MRKSVKEWKDLKFGMFIHWGLYSILGEGEWVMFNKPIDKDEYSTLTEQFTADKFSGEEWAKIAKNAGMKYMVFTTRHHDGFSLFDSKASVGNFTSMNSAAQKDFTSEYISECRNAGLKVGLYYSPLDWRFPGYFFPQMYKESAEQLKEQCHNQVRELLTNYGDIDILWYDGGEDYWLSHGMDLHKSNSFSDNFEKEYQVENFWEADKLDDMAHKLQPEIVINNRTGMRQYGDFLTPEGKVGDFNLDYPWESCMTLAGSWGWMPNARMRSLRECIQLLVRVVTGGGNLLLNVAPRADGSMEERQIARLGEIGNWLKEYGESIYSTNGGPFKNGSWGGFTWKDNTLFIHQLEWNSDYIVFPKMDGKIKSIYSLTASKVEIKEIEDVLYITVPEKDKQAIDTILVIEFNERVDLALKDFDEDFFIKEHEIISDALIV